MINIIIHIHTICLSIACTALLVEVEAQRAIGIFGVGRSKRQISWIARTPVHMSVSFINMVAIIIRTLFAFEVGAIREHSL